MSIEEQLRKIVTGILIEFPNIFLIDIIIKGVSANQKVIVLIDADETLNIDHCASISRKIGRILEEDHPDLFDGKYNLEVSSPGLDSPIKLPRQYRKNIGRELKIETMDGDIHQGVLNNTNENKVLLEVNKTTREILLVDIKKANVIVSFK